MLGEAYKVLRQQAAAAIKEAVLPREPDHPILAVTFYICGVIVVYVWAVLHLVGTVAALWLRSLVSMIVAPFAVLYVAIDTLIMTVWVVARSIKNQGK